VATFSAVENSASFIYPNGQIFVQRTKLLATSLDIGAFCVKFVARELIAE
jgi:hypothetical protein